MNAAAQGASAFAFSSYSASSFSLRGQADPASRGIVLAKQAVAPAKRAENLLSMKIKNAGKKPVRSRRSGPPANVEGYSHAAFGQCIGLLRSRQGRRRFDFVNVGRMSTYVGHVGRESCHSWLCSCLYCLVVLSVVMLVLALVLMTAADDHPIVVVEEKCRASQGGLGG